ncbi:DNA polymerase [Actinotignum sanguinis]|uniref:DNA-directed DNA polymerase n=1 Tax=Schaalia turicensis ACS-279-V-Col4 TaxID=883077 RepID=K0ZKD7_9ACTO|nr:MULTISPECIES: DNA polymerase [Actinomycetaceae]MDK7780440.1 DNA polymerase [Actinomycetaceae bacterium UMB8041B]MDK8293697.1 DNA polymerase [Actinomycetaceae bacterium UMB8039B]MDK8300128.1 DNA polymerase [Actinomycetaceae bacterium UMB1218B]MDK8608187.1 DNA polymerase [Actinomycetaceae bacterium UMB8041A]MDK8752718.1 DNA polymerase [Actinomycetaceae bacterium UMB8039A]
MRSLACDLETYSPVNLTKSGVYPYATDPEFELLLFGYSIDSGDVHVIDLASGQQLPDELLAALVDPGVVKWAHNAAFERVAFSAWLRRHHPDLLAEEFLDPAQWRCTMVWAAYLGLPMSLDAVGTALDLDVKKDSAGKKLIKQFCTPATPSVLNGGGTRNLPASDPTGWAQFVDYNRRDVEVELAIHDRLSPFPMPEAEWDAYALDQTINDTGILLDRTLADAAVALDGQHSTATLVRARELTGLENPNSPIQLKDWLTTNGCKMSSLAKAEVAAALETATGVVREVLELRGDLAKSSVKKYQAMHNVAGSDGRARGLIQFYGAGRTGRFAGRLVQVQNLPRNYLPDLDAARTLTRQGNLDALELLYDSVPDTLSQLIRTAFIPSEGCRLIVADYSAIEARVIAWLARETSTLRAFRDGKDLYCETASRMFGVPVEKHGVNAELRQKGKIATLACGYNGSVGALKAMGALRMGLAEHELKPTVDAWRAANPNIVQLWADVEQAALDAITTRSTLRLRNLCFSVESGILFITLPSGRRLAYVQPRLGENRWGGTSITYSGVTTGRKWGRLETYGGKLVENIVQAVARDLLVHAMQLVAEAGHRIVMHVHDEIVIDEPQDSVFTVADACALMATLPAWADGLPLNADGYECDYYQKD